MASQRGMQPLSIVVPLYNAIGQAEPLLDQLAQLKAKHGDLVQLIAADDASPDGTADWLRQAWPQFEIAASKVNGGYGANVMQGVLLAKQPWLCSLNSDIELLGDPFPLLFDSLLRAPSMFALMPLIWNSGIGKVENLHRLYAHRGLCWHTELKEEAEHSALLSALLEDPPMAGEKLAQAKAGQPPITSVLCGAAFLCSRERFLQLGGFSPRYRPFYWEDVDLDFRARRLGWHCATLPATAMLHRHSESINKLGEQRKMASLLLNQLRFVIDHGDLLPELRTPRLWWALRSLRERIKKDGDFVLRDAYWQAAMGKEV